MEYISLLLVIPAAAVSGLWEYLNLKVVRSFDWTEGKAFRRWHVVLGSLRTAWLLAGVLLAIPVPAFFLGLGVLYCLTVGLIEGGTCYEVRLNYLISFLFFTSLFLFLLGVSALVWQINVNQLYQQLNIRAGMLLVVNSALCAVMFPCRFLLQSKFLALEHDSEQDDRFFRFLGCGVLYVFVDAVFVLFHSGNIVPILLSAGNALLICLILLFLRQKWIIAKERTLEEEHARLAAERARERIIKDRLNNSLRHDALTGCFSRRYAVEYLLGLQAAQAEFSVVFIDLDGLKKINDEKGHQAGDRFLVSFAEETTARLSEGELLARVGGDEFLLIQPTAVSDAAERKMKALRQALSELESPISFSYGIACGDEDIEVLIAKADKAMYQDKKRNKEGGETK